MTGLDAHQGAWIVVVLAAFACQKNSFDTGACRGRDRLCGNSNDCCPPYVCKDRCVPPSDSSSGTSSNARNSGTSPGSASLPCNLDQLDFGVMVDGCDNSCVLGTTAPGTWTERGPDAVDTDSAFWFFPGPSVVAACGVDTAINVRLGDGEVPPYLFDDDMGKPVVRRLSTAGLTNANGDLVGTVTLDCKAMAPNVDGHGKQARVRIGDAGNIIAVGTDVTGCTELF